MCVYTSYAMLSSGLPWDITQVTHKPLGECVYQENTMTSGAFHGYTIRKVGITILYHAIKNTVATWEG